MMHHSRGFTLVETLIAIAVVTIVVVGPFLLAQGTLRQSYIARDQLTANALAQEGIEYMREIRDSNFIANIRDGGTRNWLYGIDGSTYSSVASPADCYNHACVVDMSVPQVIDCGGTSCASRPLYLSANNLYNQGSVGTVSRFTRTIRLTSISATETLVTITVTWPSHGTTYTVKLTDVLRKWL